ncbi:MAG: hypothetical protein GY714_14125 [Desulfobacterales bacterium]|nr:hypothetical protein [Desulfobacterales bacterium]
MLKEKYNHLVFEKYNGNRLYILNSEFCITNYKSIECDHDISKFVNIEEIQIGDTIQGLPPFSRRIKWSPTLLLNKANLTKSYVTKHCLFFYIFIYFKKVKDIIKRNFASLSRLQIKFEVTEQAFEDDESRYTKAILNQKTVPEKHRIIKKEYLEDLADIIFLYNTSHKRLKKSHEALRSFVLKIDKKFPKAILNLICALTWECKHFVSTVQPIRKQWPNPVIFDLLF